MSIESNNSMLLGSVLRTIDKRFILGLTSAEESVSLLGVYTKMSEYCINQYNAGISDYFDKDKKINNLIQELKYNCSDICIYRDRSLIQ